MYTQQGTTLSLPSIKVDWDTASHMAVHDRISGIIDDGKELKGIGRFRFRNLVQPCHISYL